MCVEAHTCICIYKSIHIFTHEHIFIMLFQSLAKAIGTNTHHAELSIRRIQILIHTKALAEMMISDFRVTKKKIIK